MAKTTHKLKVKIQVLITLCALSFTTLAQTTDSWRLATWSDETAYYYDPGRITRPKSNIVRVWLKVDKNWKSNQIERKTELNEFDCLEKKMRKVSSVSYDTSGKVSRSISSDFSQWDFVVPDSVGEELLEIFCFGKEDGQTATDAHDYYNSAEEAFKNKRFAEAVSLYKKAIALKPKDSFNHYGLSKVYLEVKQFQLAIVHANKAIEFSISSNVYLAYHNLGEIYEAQKKFDLALQLYKRAAISNKECSFCDYPIERIYNKLDRNLDLLKFYEESVIVRPNDIDLLLKLGDLQNKLGNNKIALTIYDKALK